MKKQDLLVQGHLGPQSLNAHQHVYSTVGLQCAGVSNQIFQNFKRPNIIFTNQEYIRKDCHLIERSSTMKKQAKGAMKGAAGLSVVTNMCVVQNPKTFFFHLAY